MTSQMAKSISVACEYDKIWRTTTGYYWAWRQEASGCDEKRWSKIIY